MCQLCCDPSPHTPCGHLGGRPCDHSSLFGGSSPAGLTGRPAPYCSSACTHTRRPGGRACAGSSPAEWIRMNKTFTHHFQRKTDHFWTQKKKKTHKELSVFLFDGGILLLRTSRMKKQVNEATCASSECLCCVVLLPLKWQCSAAAGRRRLPPLDEECCGLRSASPHHTGWGRKPRLLTGSAKHGRFKFEPELVQKLKTTPMSKNSEMLRSNWPVYHRAAGPSRSFVSAPGPAPGRTRPCRWHSPSPSDHGGYSRWKQRRTSFLSERGRCLAGILSFRGRKADVVCVFTNSFSISFACGCCSFLAFPTSMKRSFSSPSASARLSAFSFWWMSCSFFSSRSLSYTGAQESPWKPFHFQTFSKLWLWKMFMVLNLFKCREKTMLSQNLGITCYIFSLNCNTRTLGK